ncbi:hypothetical protein AYO44_05340 [Planctomycetaceae bacterium SCGC AG-212-F19]|nr:hypothetical protein AYO44_05340 [Planctomycetaceae bacterium SCGC AG-212-F19]
MMNADDSHKRQDTTPLVRVQEGNRNWWTRHTMSYDWKRQVPFQRFSREWFDEIDARFIHAARLFATAVSPFDKVIPFHRLAGVRVLEIGCGMGLHTELLVRAGALATAVDLSATSVEVTCRRLSLKGLRAQVCLADAEQLPFGTDTFDFVWSWGVIHHSARTAKIVREIARVLTPGGSCRVMVYNRLGAAARIAFLRDYLLRGGFLRHSFEEVLYRSTDGFSARFYIPEQFEDLFRAFFAEVSSQICGQDADAAPFPGPLRRLVLKLVSERWLKRMQARRGSFILVDAARPS